MRCYGVAVLVMKTRIMAVRSENSGDNYNGGVIDESGGDNGSVYNGNS